MSVLGSDDLRMVVHWEPPCVPTAYLRNRGALSIIRSRLGKVLSPTHNIKLETGIPIHLLLRYIQAWGGAGDSVTIHRLKGLCWIFLEEITITKDFLLWWDIYPGLHQGQITTKVLRDEQETKVSPQGETMSGHIGLWLVNEGRGLFFFAHQAEAIIFDANEHGSLIRFEGVRPWEIGNGSQVFKHLQQSEVLHNNRKLGERETN